MRALVVLLSAVCLCSGDTQPPYTYRDTNRIVTVTANREISCDDNPQSFLQGFNFSFGSTFFEFHVVGSTCQSDMIGCWPPEVDHDTGTYRDNYRDSEETLITCSGSYALTANTNPVQCNAGEWLSNDNEDLSDVCTCNESGYGEVGDQCIVCKAGTYSATQHKQRSCIKCPSGHFSASNGSTECEPCKTGTFSNSEGSVTCSKCGVGFYTDKLASEECKRCERGSFTLIEGSAHCLVCPAGHTTYRAAPDVCIGPKLGMTSITGDKSKEWFYTQLSDLGTFRDEVRVSDNQRGQWDLFTSINYVMKKYSLRKKKSYFQLPTTDSIKPLLRNVYCWVTGEKFNNPQIRTTTSGARCKQGACSNAQQLSKEPGCYVGPHRHNWENCDIPKCRDSLESSLDRCHYLDSGSWGRVINLKKGHCWDGRGYPAIDDGDNIGYNVCREPTDKPTTDHSYKMENGQIRSMRADLNGKNLCLTLLDSGRVVLKNCGHGAQTWRQVIKKGCTFKLISQNTQDCIGCYQQNGGTLCDLRALQDCNSDFVWHKFIPIDDDSCVYTPNTVAQKAKDLVYKSLKFDSKVSAKAACNHLGYYCSGIMFNNNRDLPRYTLLTGDMVALGRDETYESKSKNCDELTRTSYFEQSYSGAKTERSIDIDTTSHRIY